MSNKITFQNAVLLKFSRSTKGTEADFRDDFTTRVITAMDWSDMPDCVSGSSLEGELDQAICTLTAKDVELSKMGFELDRAKVHAFNVVKREIEGKRDKGTRLELRFRLLTLDDNACQKLEAWFTSAEGAKGKLEVSYTPQAKQEHLPGTDAADSDQAELLQ